MVLGRLIHLFHPSGSLFGVPAPTIAAVFVSLDFVSFVIQLVGGGLAGPSAPAAQQLQAAHVYMGGIGMQQVFILVFVALATRFQLDVRAAERAGRAGAAAPGARHGWRALLYVLYATLGCITVGTDSLTWGGLGHDPAFTLANAVRAQIRIVFRFFEFSQGPGSTTPLLTNEVPFYVLEAVPMLAALLCFNFVHPGAVIVGPGSKMPGLWATLRGLWHRRRRGELPLKDTDSAEIVLVTREARLAGPGGGENTEYTRRAV
jgi:hypothetical protein